MFGWRKASGFRKTELNAEVWRVFRPEGLLLGDSSLKDESGAHPLLEPTVPSLIGQLQDEGYAMPGEGACLLTWESLYNLLDDKSYTSSLAQLELPAVVDYAPELQSQGTLMDPDFGVHITGWRDAQGNKAEQPSFTGAEVVVDGKPALLNRRAWDTVSLVHQFAARPADERSETGNRRAWGTLRRSAIGARARLDKFLFKSAVLTPESLQMQMRQSTIGGTRVVEVLPSFEGAPKNWEEVFDSYRTIPDHYSISTDDGIVHVTVTPQVRTVLESIRRLEGRRIAGSRAEAFLLNPYATLGEDASAVIDEEQFEKARLDAGIIFEHFVARVKRDAAGYPEEVGLRIERLGVEGSVENRPFVDDAELETFVQGLGRALDDDRQLYAFDGNEFELLGDTSKELETLELALIERRQPRILVRYADVYDLSAYASRVENIGVERPYYSPYITKKTAEWWPESIIDVIVYTPDGDNEPVAIPLTGAIREQLDTRIAEADASGKSEITLPGFPKPIPLAEAKDIVSAFQRARKDVEEGRNPGDSAPTEKDSDLATEPKRPGPPEHLLLKSNVETLDFEEARREILSTYDKTNPELPAALKPDTVLKPHQLEGLAQLQHLFKHAPTDCRGALVADDMGLGKTLLLLTFFAWAFEQDPTLPPALVVAPVALLENWEEEIQKFFKPGALSCLVAYGQHLSYMRVPRHLVDQQLLEKGLVKFLRPGWCGDHRIVLTTYETLRDLEFSFAAEKWSIMACDEAQKVKNPNAMVTRAVKKQNVLFKIPCTGTPVENTLTDLWCLFDLAQAGLLGALNDFGRRYRKPVEAKTPEEEARVAELRGLIKPQLLRRMKWEVASLPPKHVVPSLIPLSNYQRVLYAHAVNGFKARMEGTGPSPFRNHLGLLQYLRTICTNPHPPGQSKFKPQPLAQHRIEAPKLGWLIDTLASIKQRDEKAIVFCEFKDMQQMLAFYLKETFGVTPDIINGDVEASAKHVASRQKRIKAFQQQPGFGFIILSPLSVGFGVNVQEANHVIHYTRTWNPAKEDQATDRAYRIGQQREVFVYYPIAVGGDFTTFDEKLDELLTYKRELSEDILNGSGTVMPNEWRLPEIIPGGASDTLFNKQVTIEDVVRMDWDYFESLVAALWQKKGFRVVYRTPTQDAGVDVVAFTGANGELVQCKSSSVEDATLDAQGVKDVLMGEHEYRLRHPGIDFSKWVATNQYFNATAQERARNSQVKLVNQRDIAALLKAHPVKMSDVQQYLCAYWEDAA